MALHGVRCCSRSLMRWLEKSSRYVQSVTVPLQLARKHTESRIITTSTLMQQDGLEVKELPVIIRKIYGSQYPNSDKENTVQLKPITKNDISFRDQLRECITVKQVFKLLEVPSDTVTEYSAAFALQRICQLRDHADEDSLDSFIRTAILNELCDMSTREISSLHSDMVLGLVKCYMKSANFGELFVERINEDVERRLVEGQFSILELCHLIEQYSYPRGKQSICDAIWIHLGSRYQDLDETNIAQVYSILRYMSPKHRYIVDLLEKQMLKFWWKLTTADVSVALKGLTLLNHKCVRLMTILEKWLNINIQEVRENELINILSAHIHFKIGGNLLNNALGKYVSAKSPKLNSTIAAMAMEYCRMTAQPVLKIFDAVAKDFEKNGHLYSPILVLYTLRPYGQLDLPPTNPVSFFEKVEDVLLDHFDDFEPAAMIELLASFVYIKRFPINFISKVFAPSFLAKLSDIEDDKLRLKAQKHLHEFQTAINLEVPQYRTVVVYAPDTNQLQAGGVSLYHRELGTVLASLYGQDFYTEKSLPKYSYSVPHIIDYELHFDAEGNILPVRTRFTGGRLDISTIKLAVLMNLPEHYSSANRLLGEQNTRIRHLQKMGYLVLTVSHSSFARSHVQQKQRTFAERKKYIKFRIDQIKEKHLQDNANIYI